MYFLVFFFQWMYIVPFVLVMMLAGNSDPNAGGGGR